MTQEEWLIENLLEELEFGVRDQTDRSQYWTANVMKKSIEVIKSLREDKKSKGKINYACQLE